MPSQSLGKEKWSVKDQGFDPWNGDVRRLLSFCERMETAEAISNPVVHKPGKRNKDERNGKNRDAKKGRNGKENTSNGSSKDGNKYCMVHGKNNTHTTDQCNTLKAKIKGDGDKSNGSQNKTWSKKADDAKKKTHRDLAAFVSKQVSKSIRKELNAVSTSKKEDETNDDKSVAASLNQFDLSAFNYDDMNNLKIDSDDESEGEVST